MVHFFKYLKKSSLVKSISEILSFVSKKKENYVNTRIKNFIYNFLNIEPRDLKLYEKAFIHRSYCAYYNNERLEFLGDAILQTIISQYIFEFYPNKKEGILTKIRAQIVNRQTINYIARSMGIGKLIHCSKALRKNDAKYLEGNALEALIGTIFLDQGYDLCQKIVFAKILKPYIDINSLENSCFNSKGKLLEWGHKSKKNIYFEQEEYHNKDMFKMNVKIDGKIIGVGVAKSKKEAEGQAASQALDL